MEPITNNQFFLATMAGEYDGELPEPLTMDQKYYVKIIQRLDSGGGSSVSPEEIDAAIEDYLNSHDADIVTEQELSDELSGYYNKTDIDNALDSKADSTDIPDVSGFIGIDVNNLTNYYDKDTIDAALAEKQATLTAGENISITDLTISATDTTYSAATTSADGLMSAADKAKLDGIAATAEVNVQANWSQTNSEADDYIQNKPDLSIYAESAAVTTALSGKVDKETGKSLMTADEHTKLSGIETGAQVNTVTGVKGSNEAEYRTGNISITKGNVGLGNVDNTADTDKPISTATQTALDGKVDKIAGKGLSEANFTDTEKTKLAGIATGAEVNVQSDWNQGNDAADDYIKNKPSNLVQDASYVHTDNNFSNAEKAKADGAIQSTEKGVANGVAELDANGKVPTSQLPAYVDDVLSYNSLSDFPATGEDGKIYIAKDTNLSYRWGSSEYVVISPSLALGSTSSTAYRGDWGAEDRAAIGTLSTLNTTEKSNLVGAINELKTDSDAKQRTLTFDSAPTSGSTNPVTSGGVYAALAGKQGTLDFDSSPTENSDNLVKSGVIYTALVGKADATATQTALAGKADATATQTALAGKQNALTAGANITIETVNDALTISATDTTYSDATQQTHGLMSTADKTKLDGVQTGATAVSVTQTLASGTKIGTVTVNGAGTDLYCEATTYSAGSGISISNGEISNSAPNVQADWNASGTAAEILNKPTIPNYSNATTSAAGLMSAADKEKLDGIASGAEVNVQSDWNQSDTTADDFIKNKPTNASASAAGLMSSADFKKINAQKIVANTDLNSITADGWYYCDSYVTAETLSNCPTNHAFYLEVHKHAGRYQHIVEYDTNGAAQFHRNLYSGTWGNWVRWKLTDTTYSAATPSSSGAGGTAGLLSAADKEKLDGITAGATVTSVTQTLSSGTKIGTVTVNGTGTDLYCETNTDTTYSAGTGLSLSGTTFSNAAPNVKSDWNAAAGTDAEILNKPTIPNYSNATTSAAGLMSATDKSTLNAINAGTQVSLMSAGSIDLVSASNNRLTLSSAVSNFRAIEIRYAMYYTGTTSYSNIIRAVNRDGQGTYGNIAALVVRADTAGSLSLYTCNLQLSGSNLTLSNVNNVPSFYVSDVWGYK